MNLRRFLLILSLLLITNILIAQKFIWDVDFTTKLDNREFSGNPISPSKTLFGAFIMPKVGLQLGDNHNIVFGVDLSRNFGQVEKKNNYNLIFYYNFDSEHYKAYTGIVPSKKMIGQYSRAMFSDDIYYFDTTIEGAILQYKSKKGYSELIFDWLSMFSHKEREIFALYSASDYRFNWFQVGYNAYMNHFSTSEQVPNNVVDNIFINPYVGINFTQWLPLDLFRLDFGWIQTLQRDRIKSMNFIFPNGGHLDLKLEKWGVGINNSLYLGNNLMPYYYNRDVVGNMYGSLLYFGDLFYSTDTGLLDRLEVYWKAVSNDYLNLKISCVFNIDGKGKFAWQQMATLSFDINNLTAKSIKNFKFKN